MALILARHGERQDYADDAWLAAHLQARPWDPPLSAEGRAQAKRLPQAVRSFCQELGLELGAIYSSPMQRCVETATPTSNSELPVIVDPHLGEWLSDSFYKSWACADSNGRWGSGSLPVRPEFAEQVATPAGEWLYGGVGREVYRNTLDRPEELEVAAERVATRLETLFAASPEKAVLAVGHAGTVAAAALRLAGQPVVLPDYSIPFTGVFVLRRTSEGGWESVAFADDRHLRA
ncbi:unnamed protein product [Symbiodinium natans]|uniref:Histidine phosphatase family protein n=1 Tax=Symbiodinium natans TaxID=878477 RepID=A0A812QYC7_9DINO|nr:unnamed protein product [Symbiodinium natans]